MLPLYKCKYNEFTQGKFLEFLLIICSTTKSNLLQINCPGVELIKPSQTVLVITEGEYKLDLEREVQELRREKEEEIRRRDEETQGLRRQLDELQRQLQEQKEMFHQLQLSVTITRQYNILSNFLNIIITYVANY